MPKEPKAEKKLPNRMSGSVHYTALKVLTCNKVGAAVFATYIYLCMNCDVQTGQLQNVTHKQIRAALGYSRNTVMRALEKLQSIGLLEWDGGQHLHAIVKHVPLTHGN